MLLPEDQWLLEDFKTRFATQDSKLEPASALASKLLSSVLLAIFAPVVIVVGLGGLGTILGALGLQAAGETALGLALIAALLVAVALAFKWLAVINDALVAINHPSVVSRVMMSFFIPLYGLVLTLILRSQIIRKGDATVCYGRLQIV